ncbi:MAG: addiction module protein [Endozoicomonas sp.]
MQNKFQDLPVKERIELVQDIWDSIAANQEELLPLTAQQKAELDKRLEAYGEDQDSGLPAAEVLADIRKRL